MKRKKLTILCAIHLFLLLNFLNGKDFQLDTVLDDFIGTYMPVQYINILHSTRSHYKGESKTVYVGMHTGKKSAQDKSFSDIDVIFQYPATYRSKGSEFSRQSSLCKFVSETADFS